MPRKYSRTTTKQSYSEESLREALNAVRENHVSPSAASKEFQIPRTSLRRHLDNQVLVKPGGQCIFTSEQEKILKERIYLLASRGFPLTIKEVRRAAFNYARKLYRRKQIKNLPNAWIRNKAASLDWFYRFRKDHNDMSMRVAENISIYRAEAFNNERVVSFFSSAVELYDVLNIHRYPQLIYNADETGLSSVPAKGKRVLVPHGTKSVCRIQSAERGTLTTLLPCSNALGEFIPPFIVFKGHILPNTDHFPQNTRIVSSKSGWIDHELFLSFLKHFQNFRVKIADMKCLLIVDGHRSHISIDAVSVNWCCETCFGTNECSNCSYE